MNESQWTPKVGDLVRTPHDAIGVVVRRSTAFSKSVFTVVLDEDRWDAYRLSDLEPAELGKSYAQKHVRMVAEAVRQWREEHPPAAADSELARLRAFVAKVTALELDAMSPIDALSELYELRRDAAAALKGDK